MCPKREDIIDYKGLTPDEWVRARQQILGRAQAARAGALRELRGALVWQGDHPDEMIPSLRHNRMARFPQIVQFRLSSGLPSPLIG